MTEQAKWITVHFPEGKRTKVQHEATHWHVDDHMQLHVNNGKESVASYGKGFWISVEVVKEPHCDQSEGESRKLLDVANASYASGAREALLAAAEDAEERGDIGKPGGPEAWTWLRRRAARSLVKPEDDTFLCDICETIQPLSDEGPSGSDGRTWCRDCRAEGALSA